MKTRFFGALEGNEVITAENVKDFGEGIAIMAMKTVMSYSDNELHDLYRGLIHDVFNFKPVDEPYSDGYDIASTAILFLCEHIGERMSDTYKEDKHGTVITIRKECFRKVYTYISHEKGKLVNTTALSVITKATESAVEMEDLESGYENVEAIISKMHLTDGQIDTLNCYMAGMTFFEIAKFLCVNKATVWKRRQAVMQSYIDNVSSCPF